MGEKNLHRDRRLPSKPSRKMQIRGQRQNRLMEVIDRETRRGKVDLFRGRIEQILDQASQNDGLTKTQYKIWKVEEGLDTRLFERWRILSGRIKERAGVWKIPPITLDRTRCATAPNRGPKRTHTKREGGNNVTHGGRATRRGQFPRRTKGKQEREQEPKEQGAKRIQ